MSLVLGCGTYLNARLNDDDAAVLAPTGVLVFGPATPDGFVGEVNRDSALTLASLLAYNPATIRISNPIVWRFANLDKTTDEPLLS